MNLAEERLFPLIEVGERVPRRRGKALSRATAYRWASSGVRARNGQRTVLETLKVGGVIFTSDEALARFYEALSGPTEAPEAPVVRSPAARRDADRRAAERLKALGV